MKSWTRTVALLLLTSGFLGLAVVVLARGGPWLVTVAYLVCGAVTFFVALKVRPVSSGSTPSRRSDDDPRKAKRSGNPARRAAAPRRPDDH